MSRLRRSRPFGQRSYAPQSVEPSHVFIIAVEGNATERLYFEGFYEHSVALNIHDRVIVEVLDREDTKSAPQYVKELLDEYKQYYGIESEELWMIVDRDRQSTSKETLTAIIDGCQTSGYNIALTNPCFEFWLLLHVADIDEYSEDDLLNNQKVNKNRRFLDKELSRILKGYNKSKLKFEKFMPHITTAVRQAELFENDVDKIVDKLGTNIHILVKRILKT